MAQAPQNEVVLLGSAQMGDAGALAAVIRRLSVARSLEEIMSVVTYGVRSLLHADGATVVLRDGDRCFYAEEDAVSPLWKGRRFPMSACISGWCMLHRQPVAIRDIYKDARIPIDAYRPTFVRSLAMAPVGAEEPIAALGAYWSEPREAGPDELDVLQTIANSMALAVAYVQLQQAGSSKLPRPAPQARKSASSPQDAGARRPSLTAWLQRVRRRGVRPNSLGAYAFAAGCVLVATLLREGIRATGVHGLVIYSTYYPAAVLAMLVAGRRAGIVATVLGGLAAYYFFMPPLYWVDPFDSTADLLNLLLYAGSCGLIILIIDWYQRAVRRLRQEDAKHLTLAREQGHRIQNAISVVEAVVSQSLRGDPAKAGVIKQRIRAGLAGLDIGRDGAPAKSVRALLGEELQAFELSRFSFEGEDETPLPPEPCTLFALAVHELATNAVKYGALSTSEGCVSLDWCVGGGRVSVCWREQGGPPVQPPQRRGYGTIMLRRLVEASKGSLSLDFQPTGLIAKISLPLPG